MTYNIDENKGSSHCRCRNSKKYLVLIQLEISELQVLDGVTRLELERDGRVTGIGSTADICTRKVAFGEPGDLARHCGCFRRPTQ